jgi:hypothetical protein
MIPRAISQVVGIVTLAAGSTAWWLWLFYGERFALLWRRESVYAAFGLRGYRRCRTIVRNSAAWCIHRASFNQYRGHTPYMCSHHRHRPLGGGLGWAAFLNEAEGKRCHLTTGWSGSVGNVAASCSQ